MCTYQPFHVDACGLVRYLDPTMDNDVMEDDVKNAISCDPEANPEKRIQSLHFKANYNCSYGWQTEYDCKQIVTLKDTVIRGMVTLMPRP